MKIPTIIATTSCGLMPARSVPSAAPASRMVCTAAAFSSLAWETVTVPEAKTARMMVLTVRDGLIAHSRDYADPIAGARALGRLADLADLADLAATLTASA